MDERALEDFSNEADVISSYEELSVGSDLWPIFPELPDRIFGTGKLISNLQGTPLDCDFTPASQSYSTPPLLAFWALASHLASPPCCSQAETSLSRYLIPRPPGRRWWGIGLSDLLVDLRTRDSETPTWSAV